MAIETRTIDGETVEWNTALGGPVLHHKDPDRVQGGIQAAKTRKRNEAKAAREEDTLGPLKDPSSDADTNAN